MSDSNLGSGSSLRDVLKTDQGVLRRVLDQARDCIKILGPNGRINYINSEGRCALSIHDPRTVYGKPWPRLWPEEARSTIESALAKAQSGEGSEIEAARPNPAGEKRWWRISVSPLTETDGEVGGILTVSRDITSDVQLRNYEKTLTLEMRHRLRNAYTIASAIVMLSAAKDDAAQSFAERACGRLANVALSQTRLAELGDKSWTVAELVKNVVATHADEPGSITTAGDSQAAIDGQEAMLIALIVGELTNNSLKYGALRKRRSVSLSWWEEFGRLKMRWSEAFPGAHNVALRPRDAGSGYSMMERLARSQRATFEHRTTEDELIVTLTLRNRALA